MYMESFGSRHNLIMDYVRQLLPEDFDKLSTQEREDLTEELFQQVSEEYFA